MPIETTDGSGASASASASAGAGGAGGATGVVSATGGGATVVASPVDVTSVTVAASSLASASSRSVPVSPVASSRASVSAAVAHVSSAVGCPSVAAAMSVLGTTSSGSSSGSEGSPLGAPQRSSNTSATGRRERGVGAMRGRPDRLWRRTIPREVRDELVHAMLEQLQRITGQEDRRHLRICASRYESFVWRKSETQLQYLHKLERRIESLRSQSSYHEIERSPRTQPQSLPLHEPLPLPLAPPAAESHLHHASSSAVDVDSSSSTASASASFIPTACTNNSNSSSTSHHHHRPSTNRRSRRRMQYASLTHRDIPSQRSRSNSVDDLSSSSSSSSSTTSSPLLTASSSPTLSSFPALSSALSTRDSQYFRKLRVMRAKYRDEVALVFRELCRVNTVIQHSASLRRHESSNLGDFLANLKKIIYLLEQQPDEMSGMIPMRKRTLAYLDVVESHIQRKVLPILYRLRHTYSTILRPIVLNYLRNSSSRFARR